MNKVLENKLNRWEKYATQRYSSRISSWIQVNKIEMINFDLAIDEINEILEKFKDDLQVAKENMAHKKRITTLQNNINDVAMFLNKMEEMQCIRRSENQASFEKAMNEYTL